MRGATRHGGSSRNSCPPRPRNSEIVVRVVGCCVFALFGWVREGRECVVGYTAGVGGMGTRIWKTFYGYEKKTW